MKMKKCFYLAVAIFSLSVTACGGSASNTSTNNSSSQKPEEEYNIVRPDFTPDYNYFGVDASPRGVNMTYYSDIYSRGFSWLTDENTKGTELYLVQSDKGKDADFDDAELINGTSLDITYNTNGSVTAEGLDSSKRGSGNTNTVKLVSHKVHVENLEKGKAYSYKIGSENGYTYGAFIVEKDNPEEIRALHLSDAQTKDLNKTNIWRNTFVKGVQTAGKGLDMTLFNGDQFDQNNQTGNDKEPFRLFRYANAIDVIQDYKFDTPYMSSSGNHEPSSAYSHYLMSDINYAGYDYKGAYYSYDYNFAHFVILNTNTIDDAQINWLKSDLDNASNARWKIVMMHISPYTTGDHSNASANNTITEKLTPIFSQKHVDLVLQAHDHTYNKTMPYCWDSAGLTETWNNESVVNLSPDTEEIDGVIYDVDPNGTYYVTTGAAGHRVGAAEEDGIYAEAVMDGDTIKGLNPNKTYLSAKYKIEVGKLKYSNQYTPYTFGNYTSSQNYQEGGPATGNVNAQMFGVLDLTEGTLSYKVYTVNDDTVKLFDSLDVLKY